MKLDYCPNKPRRQQLGVSLWEILISLFLQAILLLGAGRFYFWLSQRQQSLLANLELQSRAEFALDLLNRDLAAAGDLGNFFMGAEDTKFHSLVRALPANKIQQNLFRGQTIAEAGDLINLPPAIKNKIKLQTDVITIAHAEPPISKVVEKIPGQDNFILAQCSNVHQGDLALLSNYVAAELFIIGKAVCFSGKEKIYLDPNLNLSIKLTIKNQATAFARFIIHTYFIGNTGRSERGKNIYALYCYDEAGNLSEIVSDLDNMQIRYYGEITGHEYWPAKQLLKFNQIKILRITISGQQKTCSRSVIRSLQNFSREISLIATTRLGYI